MTSIGELIGNKADEIAQDNIEIGDIHFLKHLDKSNGITPKKGDASRDKFFVVLGFDEDGNVIGGVVINSRINYKLPYYITNYMMSITVEQFPFLNYNSFIDCSQLKICERGKFTRNTYRGSVPNKEMLELIMNTVKESPTANKQQLREFGIR